MNNDKLWAWAFMVFMGLTIFFAICVAVNTKSAKTHLQAIEQELKWQSANWNNYRVNYTPCPECE